MTINNVNHLKLEVLQLKGPFNQSVVEAFKLMQINKRFMVCLQKEVFPLEVEVKLCDPELNSKGFSLGGRLSLFTI